MREKSPSVMSPFHKSLYSLSIFLLFFFWSTLPSQAKSLKSGKPSGREITLDEVLAGHFVPEGLRATWHSETQVQYREGLDVLLFDVHLNQSSVLVNGSDVIQYLGHDFNALIFSPDKQFILVQHEYKPVWRDSFLAKYDVYHRVNKKFNRLGPSESGEQEFLQLVEWSNDGHALVFVHHNDIYYQSSAADTSTLRRLTSSGSMVFANGHADYIYEEEMFGSGKALWFSPDDAKLVFMTFNDSEVGTFKYPLYGEPGDRERAYPDWVSMHYPKAGTLNPTYTLHIVVLQQPTEVKSFSFPQTAEEEKHYIGSVGWMSAQELIVITVNRVQSRAHWHSCNTAIEPLECHQFYSREENSGWIDVYEYRFPMHMHENQILTTGPSFQGHLSYKHIYQFNTKGESYALTSGNFSVFIIHGWDGAGQNIYFSGTRLNATSQDSDPSQLHVYSVGASDDGELKCLTCTLQNSHGENCGANNAIFSPDFSHFFHICNGPGVPEITLKVTRTLEVVRLWVDNAMVRERLTAKDLPEVREYQVEVEGGFKAPVRLHFPRDLEQGKTYPLLIDVYGGPGSQKLNRVFSIDWGTSLASSRGVIYGAIDGRGTGRQSLDYMFAAYRRLNSITVADQLRVTMWLIDNIEWIDGKRVGIWGSSYGAYTTSLMLGLDKEGVFGCGIAVSPVINYLYYDTMYSERFMGLPTPEDNLEGYNATDVTNYVDMFRNKSFLLIHGTGDNNVHYQNAMLLARALEQKDIMFKQQTYADEDHDIRLTPHLYHSMEKFLFQECFDR